jgi:uncharacterized protein (DUF302 family)
MSYAHTITVSLPYEEAVTRTREALTGQGFGVLSEIDVRATLEAKLGSDAGQGLGDYLILGVCNPALAQKALAADPDIGLLLPCNVVIRRGPDNGTTVIQTIDAQTMVQLSGASAISEVAADADHRLLAALKQLETS